MALRFSCYLLGSILILGLVSAMAQNVATISGQLKDPSGGVLSGATVEITNENTGISRTIVAGEDGRYHARDLVVGPYSVTATLVGFQKVVRSGIVLTVGREAIVDITLPIGQITEEVSVTGDAPLVETTSSDMHALISSEQISNLPLNARDFSQLITLQPGTTFYRNQVGDSVGGFGARISVNGVRPTENSYTLDGTDITTFSGVIPAGVTGATLGVEAIQEFSIMEGNYSAQYGRTAGANIVALTKSGTNNFHGTLFEYLRNDMLDARNFFNKAKPAFHRNQFGFSLGGPIQKNKTFFFASYERLQETLPIPMVGTTLSAAGFQGLTPSGKVTISPVVQPYVNLFPQPNGQDYGNGTAQFTVNAVQPMNQGYLVARVDHQLNQSNSLFGRYTLDTSNFTQPYNAIGLYEYSGETHNQYVTVEERDIISTHVLNLARVAFARTNLASDMVAINAPPADLSGIPGRPFGGIAITGLTALSGYDSTYPRKYFYNVGMLYDDVSIDKGRHSLKFGGSVEDMLLCKRSYGQYGATWSFGSISSFLQDQVPTQLRVMGNTADPFRSFTQWLMSGYFQDDYQVSRRVTLNLGVRYEYYTVPTERYGRVTDLRSYLDPTTTVGDPFFRNPSGKEFMPRVGFAWTPGASGNLSVRASFGLFVQPLTFNQIMSIIDRQPPFWNESNLPTTNLKAIMGPNWIPNIGPYMTQISQYGPQDVQSLDWYLHNPYTLQQSLSVQRMFGKNIMAEIAYSGTRGIHLPTRTDMATPMPTMLPGNIPYYAVGAPLMNPKFGRLEWYSTGGKSNYNALKTSVRRRFSQGFLLQGSYTWSKAMDLSSSHFQNELGNYLIQNPFDQNANYGLADFHIAHAFTGNLSWELPIGRDLQGIRGAVVKGWQVNTIWNLTTGTPISAESAPTLTNTLVREEARPNLIPGGNPNPVIGIPTHYFDTSQFYPQQLGYFGNVGKSTIIGPGLAELDVSMMKNFFITKDETKKFQFRVECFNLPNRANFGLPATTLYDSNGKLLSTAGVITKTVTPSREIQLALRFEF